jgi:FixJ family two-component response regulator
MAEEANSPVDVIVVGAHQDIRLYVSVLEGGTFDFVLPPFERPDMMCVVAGSPRQTCSGLGVSGQSGA